MIVIEKSKCITSYAVNRSYFDKFSRVTCGSSNSMYWQTAASNANTLIYNIHFHAKDDQSGESFIEYKARLRCTVKIENEKEDALQMVKFIDEFHSSMNLFIKNNSFSYFSKLDLDQYQINEYNLSKMEAGIARLKDMMMDEDKSEDQRKHEQDFENLETSVTFIKNKIYTN